MKINKQESNDYGTEILQEASTLLAHLTPGDLVILGARPRQGKTKLSLELLVEAMKSGRPGVFFTLEYSADDLFALFQKIGENPEDFHDLFHFDTSDEINAEYIMSQLLAMPAGTVVVIDYLQLLDQKRKHPELMVQIRALKSFARTHSLILLFLSQIDRSYQPSAGGYPSLDDVRLPNPLDLTLFDTACFLNDGKLHISTKRLVTN